MENTLCKRFCTVQLPREVQLSRMRLVIQEALTPLQREVLTAVYFGNRSLTQIARDRGVNKSSVCRTLHRAEERLRKYLAY